MREKKMMSKNTAVIERIICNQCGKVIPMLHGRVAAGVCSIDQTWEYGSDKDGEIHEMDLCESCYDQWVENFKIPVHIQ